VAAPAEQLAEAGHVNVDDRRAADGGVSLSRFVPFASGPVHVFAAKLDTLGIMNEAVQNRVGAGGIGYDFMPALQSQLHGARVGRERIARSWRGIVVGRGAGRSRAPRRGKIHFSNSNRRSPAGAVRRTRLCTLPPDSNGS